MARVVQLLWLKLLKVCKRHLVHTKKVKGVRIIEGLDNRSLDKWGGTVYISIGADIPINNERYASLKFPVEKASVLHGFAGYFDSVLYDDLHMSKLHRRLAESNTLGA